MPRRLVPHPPWIVRPTTGDDRAASEVDKVWRRLNHTQYVTSAGRSAVIRERGTNATTLDDVCRRSGTGKGQMFYYFLDGREQLLLAVAELEAERVFDDQQPYLSELTSRAAWEAWRDLIVERYRDQGLHCPLGVLIADVGRYSPAAQAVSAQLVRRWQECVRAGIEATQAAGEANPAPRAPTESRTRAVKRPRHGRKRRRRTG